MVPFLLCDWPDKLSFSKGALFDRPEFRPGGESDRARAPDGVVVNVAVVVIAGEMVAWSFDDVSLSLSSGWTRRGVDSLGRRFRACEKELRWRCLMGIGAEDGVGVGVDVSIGGVSLVVG